MKGRLVFCLVVLGASGTLGCTGPNPLYGPGVATVGGRLMRPSDGGRADRPTPSPSDQHPDVALILPTEVVTEPLADAGSDGGVDAELADVAEATDVPGDAPGDDSPAPAPGPVAHWRFDENQGPQAADDTGNGNGGVLKRGATWIGTGFSRAKFANPAALRLDGIGYVEMTTPTLPALAAAKSITGWFWSDGSLTLSRRNMIALVNRAASASLQVGLDLFGRVAVWQWSDEPVVVHDGFILPGWHHVAYVYDGAQHRLYVDGALTDTSAVASLSAPVTSAWLGTFDGSSEMFAGRLDDVRIYAQAINAAAVRALASGADGF